MWFVGVEWHVWVSLVVADVLFELEHVVESLMVGVGLLKLELRWVAGGWQLWFSLMVEGMLFVGVGWRVRGSLLVRVAVGGWLLGGVWRSVFVWRSRMYCMMLVDGLRWFGGVGSRVVSVAVEWL